MVAKYKERKTNKPLLLFGEGIDVEGGARSQVRTPWEGDVLLSFDALVRFLRYHAVSYNLSCTFFQVHALDYAFIHWGTETPTVDHPALMTE